MKLKLLLIAVVSLALAACGGWVRLDAPKVTGQDGVYSVELPQGWVHLEGDSSNLLLTKDGQRIQQVVLKSVDLKLAFEQTKANVDASVVPADLAKYVIAELKTTSQQLTIETIENQPKTVGGKQAFKVHLRKITPRGLKVDQVIYGLVHKDKVITVSYEAPKLHYFDRELQSFEKIVGSVVLL